MNLRQFYKALRRVENENWRVTDSGTIRNDDNLCPIQAVARSFVLPQRNYRFSANALLLPPTIVMDIVGAADYHSAVHPFLSRCWRIRRKLKKILKPQ